MNKKKTIKQITAKKTNSHVIARHGKKCPFNMNETNIESQRQN